MYIVRYLNSVLPGGGAGSLAMKFWNAEMKARFKRHPVHSSLMLIAEILWLSAFVISTLFAGGVLILTDKVDQWKRGWRVR